MEEEINVEEYLAFLRKVRLEVDAWEDYRKDDGYTVHKWVLPKLEETMITKEEILKDLKEKRDEVWDRYSRHGYAGKQLLSIMDKDYDKICEYWSVLDDAHRQILVSKITSIYDHLKVPKKKTTEEENEDIRFINEIKAEVATWSEAKKRNVKLAFNEDYHKENKKRPPKFTPVGLDKLRASGINPPDLTDPELIRIRDIVDDQLIEVLKAHDKE